MNVFIDTNILVYATNKQSPFHANAVQKLKELQNNGYTFFISTQTLREYAKATTLEGNLPYTAIVTNMQALRATMVVLSETPEVTAVFEQLLIQFNPKGKPVYDCNIVATMRYYQIDNILTHNVKDFYPRYDKLISVIPLI